MTAKRAALARELLSDDRGTAEKDADVFTRVLGLSAERVPEEAQLSPLFALQPLKMRPQFGRPKYWWCTPKSQRLVEFRGRGISLGAHFSSFTAESSTSTKHWPFYHGPKASRLVTGLTGGEEVRLYTVLCETM